MDLLEKAAMEKSVSLKKYIFKFTIAYVIGLIVLGILFTIFNIDQNTGASIGILLGSGIYAATEFIKENQRIPTKAERSKLALLSLLSSWLSSAILFMMVILVFQGVQGIVDIISLLIDENSYILLVILIIISFVYYLLLLWVYGGLSKKQYDGLLKKGKI